MDKLKRSLKRLIAPAIVLLLVAIMGVFSPAVSVAAALRVNPMSVTDTNPFTITNLPARTVELGTDAATVTVPTINNNGVVVLSHAGKNISTFPDNKYTYQEIGQYEWRFYTDDTKKVLFDTYTVTVTDTTYGMTMPDNVVTVAPKDLDQLTLPLPSTYRVAEKTVEVTEIVEDESGKYAVVTLQDDDNQKVDYILRANITLENENLNDKITAFDQDGMVIDLSDNKNTGVLKVTYQLLNATSQKLLVAVPLSDIEIKNITKSQVTFANIPTAPSVKSLAYYSSISLTAPTADSAKVGSTSFNVEAQTTICQVQCYLYSDEPSDWTAKNSKIHNLTVEKEDGAWVVKENGTAVDYLEIDDLTVKIKALGWYRFQFQTSTLFGYQLDDDFDTDDVNIEQDPNNSYVRYWSDSIRIYRDAVEPSFAWVANYNEDDSATIENYNKNFSTLQEYDVYLPMTEKPDATTSQKITINYDGLVLPAIFPHDNATPFEKMKVTAFNIEQIQNVDGESITSNDNYVYSGSENDSKTFVYDMTDPLQIQFVIDGATRAQGNNVVQLYQREGLYRVRIVVEEEQPTFEDGTRYSGGYANTKTKYLYFYVDSDYKCGTDGENSPVIDTNNVFQVSDVYLWEGHTFDFRIPTVTDAHTPADDIQIDYYLVNADDQSKTYKLDYNVNASHVTVDLDDLDGFDTKDLLTDVDYYIYAVARNFNGMQAKLKVEANPVIKDENVADNKYFEEALFSKLDTDEIAQYGYAWKRAAFTIYATKDSSKADADFTVTPNNDNSYKAGEKVVFDSIKVAWSDNTVVDGQMTVAVYLMKDNGTRVPVNMVNSSNSSAEIVSAVAFNASSYEATDWSFTPGVGGTYILVITAKEHASSQIQTCVKTIEVASSGDWNITPLSVSPAAATNYTIDATISLGESAVLPNYVVSKDEQGGTKYFAKNRRLYPYDDNGNVTDGPEGYYTITVMGVNDPNCIIGNKFVPNKTGTYIFQYTFTKDNVLKTTNYVVQVNDSSSGVASIRMGEEYDDKTVLPNADAPTDADSGKTTNKVGDFTYVVETRTADNPAYAIILPEFIASNYGAATDFVVDSAYLYDYLEPIYEEKEGKMEITGYLYPAIAIPMPNVIADTTSSDEVEITVQKSGSSNYLVSSKKLNAGGSSNKASVITQIDGYYVFRPDGKFSKDCKDTEKYNPQTYQLAAVSTSGATGVYTVSYKTNSTSVNFNVTIGNLENGELAFNEGFLTYNNDDGKGAQAITDTGDTNNVVIEKVDGHRYVTIDLSKLYFTGNSDMQDLINEGPNPANDNDGCHPDHLDTEYLYKNVSVTVSYEGSSFISTSDWSDADDETKALKIYGDQGDGYKYQYKFDLTGGSGTYKVNVSMVNKYTGNTISNSIEFTIDVDATNKNTNLNTVWGIILVVLSLGLLAGMVFYFVKTARATRFVDAPSAVKDKNKVKKDKPVAPKAVEAPQEDVK
ncbi:MAG: hypothetical protein NC133_00785 [Prevotella sp.]|nr:hypothetical protein [Prevotella sp.]